VFGSQGKELTIKGREGVRLESVTMQPERKRKKNWAEWATKDFGAKRR